MTTVINNPGPVVAGESSSTGVVIGVLVAVIIIIAFFIWGWPAIRNSQKEEAPGTTNINITTPLSPAADSGSKPSGY